MTLSIQESEPNRAYVPQQIRALLLDDSTFDRARIRRLSKSTDLPLQMDEVGSLEELENAISATAYDLVLIDYRLPVGNGILALEKLKNHHLNNAAATIMITGNAQLEIAVAAMRGGCHDFLTKDQMTAKELRAAIVNAISASSSTPISTASQGLGGNALLPAGAEPVPIQRDFSQKLRLWTTQDPTEIADLLAGLDEDDEFVFH